MKIEEAFYIGYITKTKGLKGEVQVFFEYDEPELLELDVVFADFNGKLVPYFVSTYKLQTNNTANIYFDDIDHIDKAQPLLRKKIYLPLTKMPDRSNDEFHYDDLKGYLVSDVNHGELGEIIEVNEYPQQFVATVIYQEKEIMFPLNDDMIVEIDEDESILRVHLPDGLLDIYPRKLNYLCRMRFDIISVLPDLLDSPFAHSILQRAQTKGIAEIVVHNLRDYSTNKQKSVDDYPYGGGSGMVMSIPPFARCIEALKAERTYDEIIFMSPDGVTFNQTIANELSGKENIMILCGHYKGIDQRIRDLYVTREISIGDYVLSGGELPAAVLVDAIVRLIPGVLNDETSALSDSFQGELLDAPVYTRPADWNGHKVPDILLSGHEQKINDWRHEQALLRTQQRRPDLLTD